MNDNKIKTLISDYVIHINKVLNYSVNTVSSYERDLNSFDNFL